MFALAGVQARLSGTSTATASRSSCRYTPPANPAGRPPDPNPTAAGLALSLVSLSLSGTVTQRYLVDTGSLGLVTNDRFDQLTT